MNRLTNNLNVKKMRKILDESRKRRISSELEKKMDSAIEEGDFDKVLEVKFLMDRLWKHVKNLNSRNNTKLGREF